jgi:tripartite-type tricarboxylate transporter receptor subunit TctC
MNAKLAALSCLIGLAAVSPSSAQTYPSRPITIIVPFPAGGPTDIVGRLIAESMSEHLRAQVIVENVGGASGTLGAGRVARAEPDGYTVLLNNMSQVAAPLLYKQLPYDAINSFEPIGLVVDVAQTVVSKKGLPARDLTELVAYIKANNVSLANAGRGSGSHLCGLLLKRATNATVNEVPYRGTGPAINDMLGGQVDLMCDQITNTSSQIRGKSIQAYCVTSKKRVPALAELPTCDEAGLPGFEASVWHGFYAPKGTPKDITTKLNEALQVALKDEKVKTRLAELGTEPVPSGDVSPEALRNHLKAESEKWTSVISSAKIALE